MMNWHQLLSTSRYGQMEYPAKPDRSRTEFGRDYDRIIFSAPFRRLQNKTQVFPLPGSIFVHNRLTHSLEVASVGRSLAAIVALRIEKEKDVKDVELLPEIGSVVAAACLAHDLGNPPFGHSGEKAISNYFIHGKGREYQSLLSEAQWQDITSFEGNANALRILTHAFSGRRKGGFVMTYTTLAAILKYPCASIDIAKGEIHRKKYGYFQAEEEVFVLVADKLGLKVEQELPLRTCRHPLVFLVEAADDICYRIIDLEDAHRLNVLDRKATFDFFKAFYTDEEWLKVENIFSEVTDHNEQIAYLRSKTIGLLIDACANTFMENYDAIMDGCFNDTLIDSLTGRVQDALQAIEAFSIAHIYNHRSVVKIELAGYNILGGLLEELVPAVLSGKTHYAKKLLSLMPGQFHTTEEEPYHKILSVIDFVSGMTDIYAVDLYRQIKGITFSYA